MKKFSLGLLFMLIPSIVMGQSATVSKLIHEKQRKMEELEKCTGSTKGLKIAGISTIGLTAVGVVGNIAEAKKINELDSSIERTDKRIEKVQQEIDDKNEKIRDKAEKEATEKECRQEVADLLKTDEYQQKISDVAGEIGQEHEIDDVYISFEGKEYLCRRGQLYSDCLEYDVVKRAASLRVEADLLKSKCNIPVGDIGFSKSSYKNSGKRTVKDVAREDIEKIITESGKIGGRAVSHGYKPKDLSGSLNSEFVSTLMYFIDDCWKLEGYNHIKNVSIASDAKTELQSLGSGTLNDDDIIQNESQENEILVCNILECDSGYHTEDDECVADSED